MQYIVSVTKQGQISIPVQLRRMFKLDNIKKAFVGAEGNRIVIEPAQDFLSLKGSLKTNKIFSPQKTREKFIDYLSKRSK